MRDLWTQWQALREQPGIPDLSALPATLPDAASIPPREWLYGTRLIRRFVSVLAAPGGVGKSALALGQAVALATGRGFLGERVHHSVPVWVLNLEDPLDELHRRVAALMRLHRVPREALAGRLFLHSGRDRRVTMGMPEETGGIAHPDRAAIIAACRQSGIGLVVVDPFVKSHRLDENSNAQMDEAATAWAEVAEATGAAVLLVHHVRKGAAGGDIDGARGAKSLTDAARSAFLLAPMSAEEAESLAVPGPERWRYVRLDDGKANLAPRAEAARWYRLETVALGNGTPAYPAGDQVAAIAMWKPPALMGELTAADCNRALDLIAAGPGEGIAYSTHRTGRGGERWAGRVLVERFGLTEAASARIITAWLKSGLLQEAPYHDAQQRKTRMGVRVIDARRPTADTLSHNRNMQ
jgi:AAA domain